MAFPATYNFNYYRGDTFEMLVTPKTSSGAPFTMPEGFSAYIDIAKVRAATASNQTISRLAADLTVDGASIKFVIPGSVGITMSSGQTYVYDLEIRRASDGTTYTLMTGSITVTDNVVGQV